MEFLAPLFFLKGGLLLSPDGALRGICGYQNQVPRFLTATKPNCR
jgi:hypothetical protein